LNARGDDQKSASRHNEEWPRVRFIFGLTPSRMLENTAMGSVVD